MPGPHDKIIAHAAKAALGTIGFRRKGQSRLWLADHDWWTTVVEFQPSAWSKGCYLNVAAHWLWASTGFVSFDFGGRVEGHVQYQTDQQFATEAARLADLAVNEARQLADTFTSLNDTADVLFAKVQDTALSQFGHLHPGWAAYNAGIASGLCGKSQEAAEMFDKAMSGPVQTGTLLFTEADRMAKLVNDPTEFKRATHALIMSQRAALKLPTIEAPLPT